MTIGNSFKGFQRDYGQVLSNSWPFDTHLLNCFANQFEQENVNCKKGIVEGSLLILRLKRGKFKLTRL